MVGLEFEDLGADVGVEAGELGPGVPGELPQHRLQLVGVKAELAIEVAGLDVFVGVALDPRGQPQHQRHGGRRCQLGQQLQVVPVIQHHGDAGPHGQGQFVAGFVVAVQHDPLGGHAAIEGGEQFAGGHRIEAQAFRGH